MFVFGKLLELLQLNSFIPGFGLAFKSDLLGLESGLDLWLCLYPQQHYFSQCFGQKSVLCVCISTHTYAHTRSQAIQSQPAHSHIYFFLRFMPLSGACSSLCWLDFVPPAPESSPHSHTHGAARIHTHTIKALAIAAE